MFTQALVCALRCQWHTHYHLLSRGYVYQADVGGRIQMDAVTHVVLNQMVQQGVGTQRESGKRYTCKQEQRQLPYQQANEFHRYDLARCFTIPIVPWDAAQELTLKTPDRRT